jgi:hypothetical protein
MILAAVRSLPVLAQRHEFMAGYLGLTESPKGQVKQVKVTFAPVRRAAESMRGQLQSKQEELQAASKANQTDQQMEQFTSTIGVLHAQQVAVQVQARTKF